MTFAEKRRRVDTSECTFYLRDANLDEEMLLFGRDSSGTSVCVRIPTERTVYLPPSPAPPALAGLSSCKMTTLERAFPQQGEGGMREWQVVTYRSPGTQLVASAPSLRSYDTPVSAFLIARGIKCARWLTTVSAQLVPRELQRSRCHAEYTAVDVVESNIESDAAPPIVVLRVEVGGARIEQIDSVRGKVLSRTAGDVDALVAEYDPDVVHGCISRTLTKRRFCNTAHTTKKSAARTATSAKMCGRRVCLRRSAAARWAQRCAASVRAASLRFCMRCSSSAADMD
jgi:hypothetical protein